MSQLREKSVKRAIDAKDGVYRSERICVKERQANNLQEINVMKQGE